MSLHVCPGASWAVATAADDRPTRWCFACRKHRRHTWTLFTDPPERQPSYYEPVPVLRCSRCNRDRASFPGVYTDGPRYPSEAVWGALMAVAVWPEWKSPDALTEGAAA